MRSKILAVCYPFEISFALNSLSVTEFLRSARLPSPIGTFCLDPLVKVPNHLEIQRQIIIRILRYISPFPWGSPRAEAGRRTARLDTIGSKIWNSSPPIIPKQTIGGKVLWTYYMKGGPWGHKGPFWMASRLPPARGVFAANIELDVTDAIKDDQEFDVLWDSRFRVRFQPHNIPKDLLGLPRKDAGRLYIAPHGKFCIPSIICRIGEAKVQSHHAKSETEVKLILPNKAFTLEWIRELDDL